MIVMPTGGTEEQVTQLPWPLTDRTASILQMCGPLTVLRAEQLQRFHG